VELEVPIDIGEGHPLVVLHGYGLRPATYEGLADLLTARCRVIVPDLFAVAGAWQLDKIVHGLTRALDRLGLDHVGMLAHSFGGGIELEFASRYPDRVFELVFSDTLASSREWRLSAEALRHPTRLLRLATPTAASAFAIDWLAHPRQMVEAAWWGFTSGRDRESMAIAVDRIPAHVLWANRDSVLSRSDGRTFARELDATFTVASSPDGRPVDHDWVFQQPHLFMEHLDALGLKVLS
jgi:pimeloyl-ACP methyl ester carboxylesterase